MNSEDPFQKALDEAEQLMQELGTPNEERNILSGFSIDSDDEGEDIPLNDPLMQVDVHPLHEDFLSVETEPAASKVTPAPMPTIPTSEGTPTPTSTLSSSFVTSPFSTPNSAPSLDAIKSQTSRLASNFAAMAQRAANSVATAAATATNHQPHMITTPNAPYMSASPMMMTTTAAMPMNPPTPIVELDKEQKATLVAQHVGDLLPGETIIMFLSNLLNVRDSSNHFMADEAVWHCVLTYYRLIVFAATPPAYMECPSDWNTACWWPPPPSSHSQVLQMPLASMDKVEKTVFGSSSGTSNHPTTLLGLIITSKDAGRQIRFTTASYPDTLRAQEALQTYAFPGRRNLGYLFAFESKRNYVMNSIVTDEAGNKTVTLPPTRRRWDGVAEFQRQFRSNPQLPWTIWTINSSYQLCMTYPAVLAGPKSLDDNLPDSQRIIRQCATFRSENRLPALTWSSGVDGASLWRCSQPKIGLQGNRSPSDELFLKHILESASSANAMSDCAPIRLSRSMLMQLVGSVDLQNWTPEPHCALKVLDLRPRSAAIANRTGGYGYENTANYPGTTLQFCNIGNIHAVRDAYQKISALCLSNSSSDINWHVLVEDTKWLAHVRLILAAAWEAAFWIHVYRLPVLLHCSHGWDRTSQVAIVCQLLLDPYFRTREGFSVLVEKDFMGFGHPFHTRCGHGEGRGADSSNSSNSDDGQMSPIFLQVLDCTFQLVNQYPECFEFNSKYLLILSEHIYSCRFGTFLCDTERERESIAGIRQRTHCVWEYLDSRADTVNPLFDVNTGGVMLMPLSTVLRNVTLWTDRHCTYGPKPTLRWLPAGYTCPPTESLTDHQGDLRTSEDIQAALWSRQRSHKLRQAALHENGGYHPPS